MKLDRLTFMEVIKNAPLVSIDLVIINAGNEALLGLRNNEPARNYWFVPGGCIRKNERITQAFERISQEEVGTKLAFQDAQFLGVYEHFYQENFSGEPGFGTHYIVLAYKINVAGILNVLPDAQHRSYRWWTADDLMQSHEVHPHTKAYFHSDRD